MAQNFGRRIAAGVGIAAALTVGAAPLAHADWPNAPINVPSEIFPYIGVAPWLHDAIVGFTGPLNAPVVGFTQQNDRPIRDLSGGAGNVFCVISGFFGSPCEATP